MLSVAKLGVGAQQYYLDSVASGVEDYYVGVGEEPGQWAGKASEFLGLTGKVDSVRLSSVLDGHDPNTGEWLTQVRKRRTPGFDLTFSAPKSVSVLFGLANLETAGFVREAHDAAVAAALRWLEREACRTRAGADGVEHLVGEGFVAAKFVHRTSRAGDPQLHTHVLVANMTRTPDGKWRALDGNAIYWQARTAGFLYQAHLRNQIATRLGVGWGPVTKGAADIVGVDPKLLRLFATRRADIKAELNTLGLHSPTAARVAALETRPVKVAAEDTPSLHERWRHEATLAGHDLTKLDQLPEAGPDLDPDYRRSTARLAGPDGVTRNTPTFDRRDLLRAWCEELRQGLPIHTIEDLTRANLRQPEIVALAATTPFGKFTTRELLALEQRLVNQAVLRFGQPIATVGPDVLRAALDARPSISAEQATAVTTLVTSGRGVDVFIAAAGTGKTFCLDAAADAWQHAGYRVVGAALAATAAAQLETQTGISSDTIAMRTIQLSEQQHFFDAATVVVIDEAAMAGTRNLAPLLDAAHQAHAKVVLVGDPKQLDAIQAGGLLAGLARRIEPVTLTENRRQTEPWERDALHALRKSDADAAFKAYETHGRVVTGPTAIDIRDRMVADWAAARFEGASTIMLAERNTDIDDLNRRARRHLAAIGEIDGPSISGDGRDYQLGERVVCLRNNRKLGVRNGMLATITHIGHDQREITISTDDDEQHTLNAQYLDAGNLNYGYALTIHKSQGTTVDSCLLLGSDTLDENHGYTALSRGRDNNRIYLVEQRTPDAEAHQQHAPTIDHRKRVIEMLAQDRADRLAIDHPPARKSLTDQLSEGIREHYEQLAKLNETLVRIPPSRQAEIEELQRERRGLETALGEAWNAVKKLRGETPLVFGRKEHTTKFDTSQQHYNRAVDRLDTNTVALQDAEAEQREHDRSRIAHEPQRRAITRHQHAISEKLDQLVATIRWNPPTYFKTLHARPDDPERAKHWDAIVHTVEDYRIRNNITHPNDALGPGTPMLPDALASHQTARRTIDQHVAALNKPVQIATPRIEPPIAEAPRRERQGRDLGL